MTKHKKAFLIIGLILLVALIGVCIDVRGDDFLDTRSQCLQKIKHNLNISLDRQVEYDSVMFKHIKEGAILLAAAMAGRIQRDTVTMVVDQIDYNLDTSLITINKVFWKYGGLLKPLRYANISTFDSLVGTQSYEMDGGVDGEVDGAPDFFDWYFNVDSGYIFITLYPVPKYTTGAIIVEGTKKIANIQTDTSLVGKFPQIYRPPIITYATVLTAKSNGMDSLAQFYWEMLKMQFNILDLTVSLPAKP